jgi:23S rRNA (cytosine1962-C5)-methyltransferase
MLKISLKPRRSRPFFARHPWLFADSIAKVEGDTQKPTEASVYSAEGHFIARGLFNPASKLRVRLYHWNDSPLDSDFWSRLINQAIDLRSQLPQTCPDENARRLVFSEADGLSGLVVDELGPWLVCQWTSLALWQFREMIEAALTARYPSHGLIRLGDSSTAEKEGFDATVIEPVLIKGDSAEAGDLTISQAGLKYRVNLLGGQKTGFFLDQGINRQRVSAYAAGRDVLDLFCYSGGFGLAAIKLGNAQSVLGVDSSKQAIALAETNRSLNGLSQEVCQYQANDVAKALKKLKEAGRNFGLVVCDPPKYARSRENLPDALKAYARLNENAMAVTTPGGFLATFTCSGAVEPAMFHDALAQAALAAGRRVQVLETMGQPPDHPVSLACPEGRYLYGIIARIN